MRVSVQSPTVGVSRGSPVQFTATATSAHPMTGFVVYANDQNVYLTNSSSLNASVALSAGTYNIYIRAWDSTGAYGTSPPFLITVGTSPSGVQVTVQSPISGTTLVSPLRFTATATSAHPITGFVVYANDQNVYKANNSSLNANVALGVGTYNMYIRAWDSTGAYGTSLPFWLTVSPSTAPIPPLCCPRISGHSSFEQWVDPAATGAGAGGASDASSWPMYQDQTTPSLDGASAEFVISGPPYADALHWYKLTVQNRATNYLWDFWTIDDASLTAQAIEFDAFTVVPIGGVKRKFMFGSQCNYAGAVWDGWTENTSGGGSWSQTYIYCPKFSPNSWHHVLWYLKRVGTTVDQLQYVNLTVDGVTYDVKMLEPSQATDWNQVLGVQYQQDIGPSGTSFHQWIDKVKLTIW